MRIGMHRFFFMLLLRCCVLYCCGACCFKSQCFLQLSDTCSALQEIEISTTTTTNPHGREGRRRQADNGFSLPSFSVSGHYRLTDDWNHQQTNFFLGTSFLLPVPDSLSSSLLFFLFVFSSLSFFSSVFLAHSLVCWLAYIFCPRAHCSWHCMAKLPCCICNLYPYVTKNVSFPSQGVRSESILHPPRL